jgi:hypothetical protein
LLISYKEDFNLKNLNEVGSKGKYGVGVSNTLADLEDLEDLEDLDAEVVISSVWETIRKKFEFSAQENVGCNELKNEPWFKYLGTEVTNKYLIQEKLRGD